jgi:hypothetical protein
VMGLFRKDSPFSRHMSDAVLDELGQVELDDGPAMDHFDAFADDELVVAGRFRGSVAHAAWVRELVARAGSANQAAARPAASIAEQLAACLHALNQVSDCGEALPLYPGAQSDAQLGLSRILAKHPVLLHPRLRIHSEIGADSGYSSVLHAIVLSKGGARLPMSRDGLSQDQLVAFSTDGRLHRGLSGRQAQYRGALTSLRGLTPVAAALAGSDKPALLASLLHLGSHFDLSQSQSWRTNRFHEVILENAQNRDRLAQTWLRSLLTSDLDPYPEIAAALNGYSAFAKPGLTSCIEMAISSVLQLDVPRTIDGAMQSTTRMLRGLEAAGCALPLQPAPQWLAAVLASSEALPDDLEIAMAVGQQLEAHGVVLEPEQLASTAPSSWAVALGSLRHQREMRQALQRSRPGDKSEPENSLRRRTRQL